MSKQLPVINKEEFRAWLTSKAPKTKIAPKDYDTTSCPISKYYNSLGFKRVATTQIKTILLFDNGGKLISVRHEKWVDHFVTLADFHSVQKHPLKGRKSLSAKKALMILGMSV